MKFSFKDFTLRHYIRHVRKQNKHMQHVHAFMFAGTVTVLIAAFILHTEYGFWHETYRAEDLEVVEPEFDPESPGESLIRFWQEARSRFGSIGEAGTNLLEGKETYTKDQ